MFLGSFAVVLAAALLPVPVAATAAQSCGAQGVMLMQQRPGQLLPAQRGAALQRALTAAALVQRSPHAVNAAVAPGQPPPVVEQALVSAALASPATLVSPAPPTASVTAQTIASPASLLKAVVPTPVTPTQATAVQARPGVAAVALTSAGANDTAVKQIASTIDRLAANETAELLDTGKESPDAPTEHQAYAKPGYKRDWDTEWHEHEGVKKANITTTAPPARGTAQRRVSRASAVVVVVAGVALLESGLRDAMFLAAF